MADIIKKILWMRWNSNMPAKEMEVKISGEYIGLKREQWRGNIARITNDPELLEQVKKYTWTYNEGTLTFLRKVSDSEQEQKEQLIQKIKLL